MGAATATPRRGVGAHAWRYLAVGGTAFVVDAGSLWALYNGAGTPLWLATTVGFWLSFVVAFFGNKYLTFASRTAGHRQVVRYGLLVAVNYGATLVIVTALVGAGLPAVGAKVVATLSLTVVNFFAYRAWVFRD